MARRPRSQQIIEAEPGAYHCTSRCVRRGMLFGQDTVTGQDYDYRRQWLQERMQWLASGFQIDILGYGLMGNHFHCILRNRPDLVRQLSDLQVVLCWWRLSAASRAEDGSPRHISRRRLQRLLADREQIGKYRQRLSSISWFMSLLKQPIAFQANRQDGVTGRFWEGRFRSERLASQEQLLAAMVYVDLNPIRAGLAETPEESVYTGVYQRIKAWRCRQKLASRAPRRAAEATRQLDQQQLHRQIDAWLSPLEFDEQAERPIDVSRSAPEEAPVNLDAALAQATHASAPPRASNRGCLPISLEKYLLLVDWTGRQLRPDKSGRIPPELPSLFERLGFSGSAGWLETLQQYTDKLCGKFGGPVNQAAELQRCKVPGTPDADSIGQAFL
jgi:REP element-mobilizing transposase RayT